MATPPAPIYPKPQWVIDAASKIGDYQDGTDRENIIFDCFRYSDDGRLLQIMHSFLKQVNNLNLEAFARPPT